ncbi:hypothetical protein VTI74DRAFT_8424 [Chaetomium olivicolor]
MLTFLLKRAQSRPVNQLRGISNTMLGGALFGLRQLGTTADSRRDIFGGGQQRNRPNDPLHTPRPTLPRQPVARLLDFSAAVAAARQAARDRLLAAGEDPIFYPPVRYDPALIPASIGSAAETFSAITASSSSGSIVSPQAPRFLDPQTASFLLPHLVSPPRASASSGPVGCVLSRASGVGDSAAYPRILSSAGPSAPASASAHFPLYRPTPAAALSISTYSTHAGELIGPAVSTGVTAWSGIARSTVVLPTRISSHASTSSCPSTAGVNPNGFGAGYSAGTQFQTYPPSSGAAASPSPAQQLIPLTQSISSGDRISASSNTVTSTVASTQPARPEWVESNGLLSSTIPSTSISPAMMGTLSHPSPRRNTRLQTNYRNHSAGVRAQAQPPPPSNAAYAFNNPTQRQDLVAQSYTFSCSASSNPMASAAAINLNPHSVVSNGFRFPATDITAVSPATVPITSTTTSSNSASLAQKLGSVMASTSPTSTSIVPSPALPSTRNVS